MSIVKKNKKRKKLSPEKKAKLILFFDWIFRAGLILVCLIVFLQGCIQLGVGYHNFDAGRNYEFLSYKEDINMSRYAEKNFYGDIVAINSMYSSGLTIALEGISRMVVAFILLFAFSIGSLAPDYDRFKNIKK